MHYGKLSAEVYLDTTENEMTMDHINNEEIENQPVAEQLSSLIGPIRC